MSFVSEEIKKLKLRIIELEKQENETLNRYSKNVPFAKYYDEELFEHLGAIYNILQILDARLSKIENTR